eukprot:scaffold234162_cov18-Tisochrysis_lutea.AAC.1
MDGWMDGILDIFIQNNRYQIGITDRRGTVGPNSLFNLNSVNSQPESGSVAKDVTGRIQAH